MLVAIHRNSCARLRSPHGKPEGGDGLEEGDAPEEDDEVDEDDDNDEDEGADMSFDHSASGLDATVSPQVVHVP